MGEEFLEPPEIANGTAKGFRSTTGRQSSRASWVAVLLLTVFSVFSLFFMEWLFFVTKPSFLTSLTAWQQSVVLVAAPLVPIFVGLFAISILAITGLVSKDERYQNVCKAVGRSIPAFVLTASGFLLIDNFTVSLFRFGIRSSHGILKACYALLFCLMFAGFYRSLLRWEKGMASRFRDRTLALSLAALVGVSLLGAILSFPIDFTRGKVAKRLDGTTPNILLIGSDGLAADNMAVYGYRRNTTPFISKFSKQGLICEYALPNCGDTLGSIVSILTGKLPTQTRVLYAPDILRGEDAYQHLPGLLRQYGYRSFQIAVRNFADAYDFNMRSGFDSVNDRSFGNHPATEILSTILGQDAAYFLLQTYQRVTERLLHAFGGSEMVDAFAEVTQATKKYRNDLRRLKGLFSQIDFSDQPFFGHIHFMVTHGDSLSPRHRVFSAGHEESVRWNVDSYDDAILDFDQTFKKVVGFLREKKKLDNTVIVLYSDHSVRHIINARIPLIFWFPDGLHKGRVTANVQNLDIAPTLLDFLEIRKPDWIWMVGQSLISDPPDPCRWIVSTKSIQSKVKTGRLLKITEAKEPFFTLGTVAVAICNKYYNLNLLNMNLRRAGEIQSNRSNCNTCPILAPDEAVRFIINHLRQNGYDTRSLEETIRRAAEK